MIRNHTVLLLLLYPRPLPLLLLVQRVLPRGFPVLLLQVAPQGGLVGEAGVAVGTVVRPLAAVEVHVVDQRGLLRERLVAQRALVRLADAPVHGHVAAEVGRVVEVLAADRKSVV